MRTSNYGHEERALLLLKIATIIETGIYFMLDAFIEIKPPKFENEREQLIYTRERKKNTLLPPKINPENATMACLDKIYKYIQTKSIDSKFYQGRNPNKIFEMEDLKEEFKQTAYERIYPERIRKKLFPKKLSQKVWNYCRPYFY